MSAVEMESLRRSILRGIGYASLGVALIATPVSSAAAYERMAAPQQAQAQDQEQADDSAQDSQSQEDRDQAKRDAEQAKRDREQEQRDREQEKRDREQESRDREQELYERGREALDEDRYDRAASAFTELAKRNGPQTDAALYWQAYAENRQGQRDAALATLAELKHRFPQSRWQKDAGALELEVRQRTGQAPRPESQDDEDLKMLAIQGMMNCCPEKALPQLEKMLNGADAPKLKSKALFVIAQSGSPEAKQILGRIASGQSNPELQRKAVDYLGMFGGGDSHKILADVYAKSSDESLKRAILRSYMISSDKEDLFTAAKSEKSESVRGEAIRQLGLVHGVDELQQLYQRETSNAVKREILQAFFLAGDSNRLVQAATTEKDPELRRNAVRNLGLINSPDSAKALQTIYAKDSDESVRREVLNAYFIQNNAAGLVAIARNEKNPELKKEAVSKLAIMHNKEASDYLMEILQK
ncbi:MAG TPA: HEAT repeat domain-containing protein [Candidatus Sulfotelmatobacter sp.]|nr:HEAT repeat domain-containing protein [Candidatus Sulfotelmatobacter sp.]